jgi:phage head maturation protease
MLATIRADPVLSTHPEARTLSIDAGKMRIRSVITTIDPDRAGDVVVPTGLRNAEEYLMNPVVLWAHNRSQFPPIGTCEWLDVQPRRVVAETRFAQDVPFAEDIFRLYEQGVLRGWSIGFVPRKAKRVLQRGREAPGLRVEEWDLLEYSAVPIPENPGALTVALQKGLVRDPDLKRWLGQFPDWRAGRRQPPEVPRIGDVLDDLIRVPDEYRHSE